MCFCSAFGQTFFIALSGGSIRAEYGLSNGQFGSLYMFATLCSALTLPMLGRIVDRISVSSTMLLIGPGLAIACVLMAFSESVVLLGMTLYLLRLFGQGMMIHTAMTAMGRWFSHHRGRAVALTSLGLQVGEATLPLVFVLLFAVIGWRQSWLVASVFVLLFAFPAIYRLMRDERQAERLPAGSGRAIAASMDTRAGPPGPAVLVDADRHFGARILSARRSSFIRRTCSNYVDGRRKLLHSRLWVWH